MFRLYGLRLLKRGVTDLRHAPLFPCANWRRISTSKAGQSITAATTTLKPHFFSPNHAQEILQVSDVMMPAPLLPTTAIENLPGRDTGTYKVQSIGSVSELFKIYSQLSKSRLTFLVVLSSMAGVAMCPLPTTVPILLSTALGTALCSAAANTFNQLSEVPLDAQMARTRTRPLVRGAISVNHAAGFGIVTGLAGPAILAAVNPTAAFLGAANIVLYSGVYTTLKRVHVSNTWVGAVVGGIPPLIGWTACGGHLIPSSTFELFLPSFFLDASTIAPILSIDNPLAPLALFGLLYSWQFPHFNSLAHMVRDAYTQGGYKMLPVTNTRLNTLVSLRHSIALAGICAILTPLSGLTTWMFALTSLVPNIYLTSAAWKFWKSGTDKNAKILWNISLWYLPVVLALMMFHKQGMEWLSFLGPKDTEAIEMKQEHT